MIGHGGKCAAADKYVIQRMNALCNKQRRVVVQLHLFNLCGSVTQDTYLLISIATSNKNFPKLYWDMIIINVKNAAS